jgi:hypothetical protein
MLKECNDEDSCNSRWEKCFSWELNCIFKRLSVILSSKLAKLKTREFLGLHYGQIYLIELKASYQNAALCGFFEFDTIKSNANLYYHTIQYSKASKANYLKQKHWYFHHQDIHWQ